MAAPYALEIGLRYLRSKKSSALSVITWVAVVGVALGVGALLSVLSITTGFQQEFRDKVLGVNAHVLVLKYGVDFDEYREVVAQARARPDVAGAAPFVIHEMMLAQGDQIGGVLVKGVDPDSLEEVLDLPRYVVDGSLSGLRVEGTMPPLTPDDVLRDIDGAGPGVGGDPADPVGSIDLDAYLESLPDAPPSPEDGVDATGAPGEEPTELSPDALDALLDRIAESGGKAPLLDEANRDVLPPGWATGLDRGSPSPGPGAAEGGSSAPEALDAGRGSLGDDDVVRAEAEAEGVFETLPEVDVPTPEEVEAGLAGEVFDPGDLPDDAYEREIFDEDARLLEEEEGTVATDDLPGIVVGVTLAESLGLGVGDRVKVVSPLSGLDATLWAPEARTPKSRDFRVIALFQAGFQEYDSRLVYVDVHEAQRFFDHGDVVNGVEITLHDLERAPLVAQELERELGGGPFHTMDWRELNQNLFTALETQKQILTLVIATIVVVAAFNVIATLIMLVLEKKREIAILKAMGAKDRTVLGIFAVQGIVIGIVGTALGLILGAAVVLYLERYEFPLDPKVYLIDHLPVVFGPTEFLVTGLIALGICSLATLPPSWWAARLLPAEGVRYD
jgi:lipoprotein-releasing system permease protein